MLVEKASLYSAYDTIKEDAYKAGTTSVQLFVSAEADSLCACKIITSLLRSDCISYRIRPVSGYDDLKKFDLKSVADELKTIIMINCGGTVDLRNYLNLAEPPLADMAVYVLDSHRPYNLANVSELNDQIRLLHDPVEGEIYPDDEDIDSDSDDSDEEDDEEGGGGKRRRTGSDSYEVKQKRRERKRLVKEYYRGSYFGTCASVLAYDLAQQESKDSNDLLWMCILGLTDQWIHERIDQSKYALSVADLKPEVSKHNQITNHASQGSSSSVSRLESDSLVSVLPVGFISSDYEYRFMLVRHWNLYASMYHSQYVASRLGIWKDPGRRKLATFLAKMGVPLAECQQKFAFMRTEFKKLLREKIELHAPQYGLNDVMYGSFYLKNSPSSEVSASDMVYSLSALLEQPGNPEDDAAEEKDEDENEENWEADRWRRNFWDAYDALGSRQQDVVERGLQQSIKLQEAIVRQGVDLIKKKKILTNGPFRYCVIDESPDLDLFAKPLAIGKLALFLVDAQLSHQRKAPKPFVICCANKTRMTYQVAGLVGKGQQITAVGKNNFGDAFRDAVLRTESRYAHDGFDNSVLEVQKDDLNKFLEYLGVALSND